MSGQVFEGISLPDEERAQRIAAFESHLITITKMFTDTVMVAPDRFYSADNALGDETVQCCMILEVERLLQAGLGLSTGAHIEFLEEGEMKLISPPAIPASLLLPHLRRIVFENIVMAPAPSSVTPVPNTPSPDAAEARHSGQAGKREKDAAAEGLHSGGGVPVFSLIAIGHRFIPALAGFRDIISRPDILSGRADEASIDISLANGLLVTPSQPVPDPE